MVFADAKTGDLAIHDLVTDTDRRLTKVAQPWNDHADAAVMSRDGRHIAFSWYVGSKGRYELRLLASEATSASSPKVLIDNQDISAHSAVRVVSRRSVDCRASEAGRQHRADCARRQPRRQSPHAEDHRLAWCVAPHFLPDGRHLAFDLPVTDDARQRDLFVLSADGSRETAVDTQPGYDTALGWSPDGKSLFSTATGPRQGDVDAAHGRRPSRRLGEASLRRSGNVCRQPRCNCQRVAREHPEGRRRERLQRRDGLLDGRRSQLSPEPLTDSYLWDHGHQSWSPDGRFTVYSTFGRMARALRIVRTVATAQIRDITPKVTNFSFPRWSSSRLIVFQGSDLKGRQGIYRLDVETGEVSPVATGDGYLSWASSTRDG